MVKKVFFSLIIHVVLVELSIERVSDRSDYFLIITTVKIDRPVLSRVKPSVIGCYNVGYFSHIILGR